MTLIGATTENPYFEVNSALLSRVPDLRAASRSARRSCCSIVARGAEALEAEVPDEVVGAGRATGRRRRAQRARTSSSSPRRPPRRRGHRASSEQHVEDAARKRPLALRQGRRRALRLHLGLHQVDARLRPDAAVYYLAAMLEGGEDARFIARRMIVLASEDIGNADPRALARRRRGGAGGRARRPPGGPPQPGAGRDLPRPRAEVERVLRRAQGSDRRRARARADSGRPTRCATRATAARRSSAAARATSTRTTTRAASRPTICPEPVRGKKYYRPRDRRSGAPGASGATIGLRV